MRHMVAQEGTPALTGRAAAGHILGDGRLSHRKTELEQLAMNARCAPKQILNAHTPDQCPQIRTDLRSASQVPRFPAPVRCQRTRVSGRMVVMALRTDGNQRYNWMKNRRSLFVNWTRPRIFRCSTISCCLSAAFSASSRLLDLKIEPPRLKRKNISAAIAADVKRFYQQIKTDDVFGTHNANDNHRRAVARSHSDLSWQLGY